MSSRARRESLELTREVDDELSYCILTDSSRETEVFANQGDSLTVKI
jgi:hypothetical protein